MRAANSTPPSQPVLTRHALQRMRERGVSLSQVRAVLDEPFVVQQSTVSGRSRVVASALHGARREWLVIVVAAATGHVITVYWRSGTSTARRAPAARHARPKHMRSEEIDNGAA